MKSPEKSPFVKILMERDGMSLEEANREREFLVEMLNLEIHHGTSLIAIEEAFMEEYGLEPEYLEEFIWGNV